MPHSAIPAATSGPDDDPVRGSAVAEGTGPRVGAVVGAELPGAGTVEGGVGVGVAAAVFERAKTVLGLGLASVPELFAATAVSVAVTW